MCQREGMGRPCSWPVTVRSAQWGGAACRADSHTGGHVEGNRRRTNKRPAGVQPGVSPVCIGRSYQQTGCRKDEKDRVDALRVGLRASRKRGADRARARRRRRGRRGRQGEMVVVVVAFGAISRHSRTPMLPFVYVFESRPLPIRRGEPQSGSSREQKLLWGGGFSLREKSENEQEGDAQDRYQQTSLQLLQRMPSLRLPTGRLYVGHRDQAEHEGGEDGHGAQTGVHEPVFPQAVYFEEAGDELAHHSWEVYGGRAHE
ncbi:hypothetical protein DFH09DRAFT_1288797 [Mycena vulgaris]|nr:hypothetical protein DFH09DRAFT_1288797 [Mycena vulgaris]